MTDDEYTIASVLGEWVVGSIIATPFFLGWYVILSTLLGNDTYPNEYLIVCVTIISAILVICLFAYAANRPDKQVELINPTDHSK